MDTPKPKFYNIKLEENGDFSLDIVEEQIGKLPKEVQNFKREFDNLHYRLGHIVSDDGKLQDYRVLLYDAGFIALCIGDIEQGWQQINQLKAIVVHEIGLRKRAHFIERMLWIAILIGLPTFALGVALHYAPQFVFDTPNPT